MAFRYFLANRSICHLSFYCCYHTTIIIHLPSNLTMSLSFNISPTSLIIFFLMLATVLAFFLYFIMPCGGGSVLFFPERGFRVHPNPELLALPMSALIPDDRQSLGESETSPPIANTVPSSPTSIPLDHSFERKCHVVYMFLMS